MNIPPLAAPDHLHLVITNVPLNDALASVDPGSDGAGSAWGRYLRRWTAWNHVRVAGSLGAGALLAVALLQD